MTKPRSIFIGFDSREVAAFAVARESVKEHLTSRLPIFGLVLDDLIKAGLYTRPTERRLGLLYDNLSIRDDYNGQMSTEFALSRFLTPVLASRGMATGRRGWAVFMDCDMLVRSDMTRLFEEIEREPYAVMCVKHNHEPSTRQKMDGCQQSAYSRKNWSSFMAFNCDHPANAKLTPELINNARGLDLHQFCWLQDNEIGDLPPEWNYIVGHTRTNQDPKCVHFSEGGPWFKGFENIEFAGEWRSALNMWANENALVRARGW